MNILHTILTKFRYVLEEIGISNFAERAQLINAMSHTSVFGYELIEADPEDKNTIVDIYKRIQDKYQFKLH